jgi:type I restriction enzyme M protein
LNPEVNDLVGLLWKATDVLRMTAAMERHTAVGYIFRLLLLKLLSDMAEGPATSDSPQFVVPTSARWSQLRYHQYSKLGLLINEACAALEKANPSLGGLLRQADFASVELDARSLEEVLHMLSGLPPLSGEWVSDGKLGEATDRFLHRLAETSGRGYGDFYTPPSVARLLAELIDPQEGMRICDPVCGVGELLAECARQVASKSAMRLPHAAASLKLEGQERNAQRWALCRMNLLLHGIIDAHIELGNVLWSPPLDQGHLRKYDGILANPPWALSDWGAERAAYDAFGRFNPVPPRNNADYAFVQHCLAALEEGGRAVLLLPRGVLLRSGIEGQIRHKLLEEDRLEAIIGLPGGLLYGTGIAPVILVLTKGKPTYRRERVLFIDASESGVKQGRLLRTLSQDNIAFIVKAFQDFKGDPRYVRVAHLDEVRALNWNLTIERYVEREEKRERFEIDEHLDALAAAEKRRDEAARRMDDAISRLKRFYPPDP